MEELELIECFILKSVRYIQRDFTFLLQSLGMGGKTGNINSRKENLLLKEGNVLKIYQLTEYWENEKKGNGWYKRANTLSFMIEN